MPQKKNADSLELIRGKAGRMFGHVSFLKCILILTEKCRRYRIFIEAYTSELISYCLIAFKFFSFK